MMLLQITLDEVSILNAVGDGFQWIGKAMVLFLEVPAVYFVAFAVVVASAGIARKFVPIKRK